MSIFCTKCGNEIKGMSTREENLDLNFCNRNCCLNWEQTRKCYTIARTTQLTKKNKKVFRYYDSFDCLWTNTYDTHDIFFSAFDAHELIIKHSLSNAFLLSVGRTTEKGRRHANRISKVQRQKERP